jgi:hypothetical protein
LFQSWEKNREKKEKKRVVGPILEQFGGKRFSDLPKRPQNTGFKNNAISSSQAEFP